MPVANDFRAPGDTAFFPRYTSTIALESGPLKRRKSEKKKGAKKEATRKGQEGRGPERKYDNNNNNNKACCMRAPKSRGILS